MADSKREERCGVDLNPDQFRCSVCLDLFIEPVTLHCGHSFCQSCIKCFWDVEDVKGKYSCPDCREKFSPRPEPRRNITLAEVRGITEPYHILYKLNSSVFTSPFHKHYTNASVTFEMYTKLLSMHFLFVLIPLLCLCSQSKITLLLYQIIGT